MGLMSIVLKFYWFAFCREKRKKNYEYLEALKETDSRIFHCRLKVMKKKENTYSHTEFQKDT